MEYIDMRKVGKEGLREIRRQVVRLKKLGKTGEEEQRDIRKAVKEKKPEDFGISGKLWTLGRTGEYIEKKFQKRIHERTLSDYMKRWGMSCQRPAKRARKQNRKGI